MKRLKKFVFSFYWRRKKHEKIQWKRKPKAIIVEAGMNVRLNRCELVNYSIVVPKWNDSKLFTLRNGKLEKNEKIKSKKGGENVSALCASLQLESNEFVSSQIDEKAKIYSLIFDFVFQFPEVKRNLFFQSIWTFGFWVKRKSLGR